MTSFSDYLSNRNNVKEHIRRIIDEMADTPKATINMDTKIYNRLVQDGVNINKAEMITYRDFILDYFYYENRVKLRYQNM